MVSVHRSRRAEAETQREVLQPACAGTSAQTGLPRTGIAVQTLGCTGLQQLEVPLAPEGRGGYRSCMRAQLEQLFKQAAVSREEPNRRCSIWEREQESGNVVLCAVPGLP